MTSSSETSRAARSEAPPGTYAVRQAAREAYTLAAIGCDDADSTGSLADRAATVRLAAGEQVTCTFTARRDAEDDAEEDTEPSCRSRGSRGGAAS